MSTVEPGAQLLEPKDTLQLSRLALLRIQRCHLSDDKCVQA